MSTVAKDEEEVKEIVEEKASMELELRNRGNELFKQGDFEGAIRCYEKNTMCSISSSNAAEASLRLNKYASAEEYANKALSIERKHHKLPSSSSSSSSFSGSSSSTLIGSSVYQKSITRLVKAVVMQDRLAEGHVLVADSGLSIKARVTLHATVCGSLSPYCRVFREGMYLRKPMASSYGVYSSVVLHQNELVLVERAIQPWSVRTLLSDDNILLSFLVNTSEMAFACLNGFYPRDTDEIPMHIQSLQVLYGRVRTLLPGRTEAEYIRYLKLLARIKLNSHSDGCHGFVTFFNHSCEPNCYVRDDRDISQHHHHHHHQLDSSTNSSVSKEYEDVIQIYTLRPIAENEELCISYLGPDELKQPALVRASIIYNSWGHMCQCTRCAREM